VKGESPTVLQLPRINNSAHHQQQQQQQHVLSDNHAVLGVALGAAMLSARAGSRPHTPSHHQRQSSQDQQCLADHLGLLPVLVLPSPAALQLDAVKCHSHCQSSKGSKHGTPRSEQQPRSGLGTPRSREMSPSP
jgi:hypothetical protein